MNLKHLLAGCLRLRSESQSILFFLEFEFLSHFFLISIICIFFFLKKCSCLSRCLSVGPLVSIKNVSGVSLFIFNHLHYLYVYGFPWNELLVTNFPLLDSPTNIDAMFGREEIGKREVG